MIIREARPAEQVLVGELRVAAYRALGLLPEGSRYEGTLRGFGFGSGSGCTVLVAVDADRPVDGDGAVDADGPLDGDAGADGEIIGTITFEPFCPASELARDETEADIRAFAVGPRAQGKGAGRRLLTAVIDYAAGHGIRTLRLCTQPAMTSAQRLYAAAGFARTPGFDFEPVPGLTLRAYELALKPLDRGRLRPGAAG